MILVSTNIYKHRVPQKTLTDVFFYISLENVYI